MKNEIEENKSVEQFYELLSKMRAISPIYEKIIKHLVKSLAPEISDDAQKVLYVYFSLLEDGNTRIPLDSEKLLVKWNKKWEGLVVQAKAQELDNNSHALELNSEYFKAIFEAGIKDLLNENYSTIINYIKVTGLPRISACNDETHIRDNHKLFVIDDNYLYADKYYNAKLIIEDKFKELFKNNVELENDNELQSSHAPSNGALLNIVEEISRITNSKIQLKEEQLKAVSSGINENIIVTGGPGTGKTTVVAFILWFLLKNNKEYLNSNIYLTAPSGKASDRVGESLKNTLEILIPNSDEQEIKEKLLNLESYTIHRLLKFNPVSGRFTYNSDNKFENNSIFVIDEASMIDISMFAFLLEAIPENARVFILGDVDQLPSVDAGAVLGDLLNSSKNVVRLNESIRFKAGSEIGNLKEYIQNKKLGINTEYKCNFVPYNSKDLWNTALQFLDVCSDISLIEDLLIKWINKFYFVKKESICSLAEKVNPLDDNPDAKQIEFRNQLWNIALGSKILCAEKRSLTGLDRINSFINNYLKQYLNSKNLVGDKTSTKSHNGVRNITRYFCGQQLIITKNQEMYKLYNGDTGVVVVADNGVQYLMVRKNNEYAFYPLSIFPADSIENAFAITIHKSQGSEYNHILMFLPNLVGHRVLTNQIVYTGITRAKENVTIVGSNEAFDFACQNVIERDTGISLGR